jgi:hypothetical protein
MSAIPTTHAYIDKDRANSLVNKWSKILDYSSKKVAPIEEQQTRINTAILLENQERWCLTETNTAGNSGVFGTLQGGGQGGKPSSDFYASGDARLPKVLIPMIRRTFPELITNDLVGVQPMTGPVGLAFALRYKYQGQPLGATAQDNGFGSAANTVSGPGAAANGREAGYQYLNTAFTGTSASWLSGSSDFAMIDQDQGVAQLLSNFELTSNIPQFEISYEKTAVEAGTRRLAAKWSTELEQDLKTMNGIDVDNELTNTMSYEIQAEIDREMIVRMCQIALNAGAGTGFSFWSPTSADGRWLGERNRDFYAKVIVEANRVGIRNRRGSANFIVCTPRVSSIFEMLPEFKFMDVNGTVNTAGVGIAKVGSVGGRFQIYRDTRTEAQTLSGARGAALEYALLGFKGAEFYDTGIVYCPYIPVMLQRTIAPNDFSPRVGIMTRYGVVDHIFGASLYYHIIIVKNLGEVFTPGANSIYMS